MSGWTKEGRYIDAKASALTFSYGGMSCIRFRGYISFRNAETPKVYFKYSNYIIILSLQIAFSLSTDFIPGIEIEIIFSQS